MAKIMQLNLNFVPMTTWGEGDYYTAGWL